MNKLSKTQVRDLSGKADDVSASLDHERTWYAQDCAQCGTTAHLAEPAEADNQEAYVTDVDATLPDGRTVPVTGITMARPAPTLRWTCDNCGHTQETSL